MKWIMNFALDTSLTFIREAPFSDDEKAVLIMYSMFYMGKIDQNTFNTYLQEWYDINPRPAYERSDMIVEKLFILL